MTLGNMRDLGVLHRIAFCRKDACRHQALIEVSKYPDDVEVPSFQRRAKCGNQLTAPSLSSQARGLGGWVSQC
jgi:hypothetical protein